MAKDDTTPEPLSELRQLVVPHIDSCRDDEREAQRRRLHGTCPATRARPCHVERRGVQREANCHRRRQYERRQVEGARLMLRKCVAWETPTVLLL